MIMEELEDAGWEASDERSKEEYSDKDIKAMFEQADTERRDSEELVAIPRKVNGF